MRCFFWNQSTTALWLLALSQALAGTQAQQPNAVGTPWENVSLGFYVQRNETYLYGIFPNGRYYDSSNLEVYCKPNDALRRVECSCYIRVVGFSEDSIQKCKYCGYGGCEGDNLFADCRNIEGIDLERSGDACIDDCAVSALEGVCKSELVEVFEDTENWLGDNKAWLIPVIVAVAVFAAISTVFSCCRQR